MSKVIVVNVSEKDGKKRKKPTINLCGFYDASSNLFPATGGSGKCEKIKIGDLFDISVEGTLGTILVPVKSEIRALCNNPGQDSTKWKIKS